MDESIASKSKTIPDFNVYGFLPKFDVTWFFFLSFVSISNHQANKSAE